MELSRWKVVSALLLIWALHLPVNEAEVLVEQQLPAFLLEMQSPLVDESAKAYKELLVNGSGLDGAELCFAAKLICKDVVGGHGLKQHQDDLPMWLKHGQDEDLPMWLTHHGGKEDLPMWLKHHQIGNDLPMQFKHKSEDFDLPMWINHKNIDDLPMWIKHKQEDIKHTTPRQDDLPMWINHKNIDDLPMWINHKQEDIKHTTPREDDLPMWINHKNAKEDDLPMWINHKEIDDLPMWIKHKAVKDNDLPMWIKHKAVKDNDLPMWIRHNGGQDIDDLPMWINHKAVKDNDLPMWIGHNGGHMDDLPMWLNHDHVPGHSMPKAGNIDPHKYFRLSDLVSGKRIVFITTENPAPKAAFLHKDLLEVLPFSSKNFSTTLSRLGIESRSEQANEMRATLGHCEGKTKDEVETISKCYNSLEEMIKHVNSMLGDGARVLSTNVHKGTESVMVAQVTKAGGHDAIICHVMKFPYAVYFCHRLRETETFEVSMQNEEGKILKAMAICHMETSEFTANLVAFYMLGMAPGDGEVCHWLAHRDLVWIPNAQSRSAL